MGTERSAGLPLSPMISTCDFSSSCIVSWLVELMPSSTILCFVVYLCPRSTDPQFPSLEIRKMKGEDRADKIAVVVGTVTNDLRIFKIPKLKIAALHVTEKARERILKAGGEVMTLDQL